MKYLTICTFNIQNNKENRNSEVNPKLLQAYIIKNSIDIICTQELSKKFKSRLNIKNYNFFGKPRFKSRIMKLNPYNESNMILSNQLIEKSKTYYLPRLPERLFSLIVKRKLNFIFSPRIVTVVKLKNHNITIINTHLEYRNKNLQLKQLNKLTEIISLYAATSNIILTGDFNMKATNNSNFKAFILVLKEMGINIVLNKENTFKGAKNSKILDYIFVSKELLVTKVIIEENLLISDHKPMIVKIKLP